MKFSEIKQSFIIFISIVDFLKFFMSVFLVIISLFLHKLKAELLVIKKCLNDFDVIKHVLDMRFLIE